MQSHGTQNPKAPDGENPESAPAAAVGEDAPARRPLDLMAGVEGPALPPPRGTDELSPQIARLAGLEATPAGEGEGKAGATDKVRHPLIEMLLIAAPTVVTMTSYTVMQFFDGFMVSRAGTQGDVNVAAQGNGGMTVWLTLSVVLGLVGVINTYVAQNLGAGRPERGPAYAWNGLWLSLAMALLMVPWAFVVPMLYRWLKHPEPLLSLETSYAQILCFGAFCTLGSRALSHFFYGIHRPLIIMLCALGANVINIFGNTILIFGRDGIPADWVLGWALQPAVWIARALDVAPMGVTGAAVSTVAGQALELIVPLGVFLSAKYHKQFKTRAAWRPSLSHIKDIWKIGWPAGLMFGNEMICWGYLMVGLLPKGGQAAGEDPVVHSSAGWIALRYMHLSFMPAVGMSIAVTALVGKCMGMGRPDLAAKRARLGLGVTMAYMAGCALVFVLFREELVGVFIDETHLEAEKVAHLVRIGSGVMIAAAVFQIFDALGITLSGALRGAGDTVWPGVLTVILAWTVLLGGGHLMVWLAPGLGSLGPWMAASAYIISLGLFLLARFVRGKWKSIRLVDAA